MFSVKSEDRLLGSNRQMVLMRLGFFWTSWGTLYNMSTKTNNVHSLCLILVGFLLHASSPRPSDLRFEDCSSPIYWESVVTHYYPYIIMIWLGPSSEFGPTDLYNDWVTCRYPLTKSGYKIKVEDWSLLSFGFLRLLY